MNTLIKCPFCTEDILSEAIKCKHCGEYLYRDNSTRGQGKITVSKPDNTTTIVVIALISMAIVVGFIIAGAFSVGLNQSSPATSPQSLPSNNDWARQPIVSAAYQAGYSEGKSSGEMDRRYTTTDSFQPDNARKILRAGSYGYRLGSVEYGDFWAGYEAGYLEARY